MPRRTPARDPDITALIPIVRRVIRARVSDASAAEDLVQETLVRVLGAAHRIEPGMLEPYAIVTARNVVASMWKERDRRRRNQHRVLDLSPVEVPDDELLRQEDGKAIATALERLSERERQTLLAHEVSGLDTRVLGADLGLTAGAVAAQLNRSRARLRVEYLLALHDVDPPTEQCRPVLLALSGGERRRHGVVLVLEEVRRGGLGQAVGHRAVAPNGSRMLTPTVPDERSAELLAREQHRPHARQGVLLGLGEQ